MLDRPAGWSPAPPGLLPGTGPAPSSVFLTARLPGSRGAGGEGGGLVTHQPDSQKWTRFPPASLGLDVGEVGRGSAPPARLAQLCGCGAGPARCPAGCVGISEASARGRRKWQGSLLGRGAPGPGTHGGLMGSSLSRAQERAGWTGEHPRGRHPVSPGGAVGGAGAGGRGSE